MKKILVDTNIILDLLAKRKVFYDSASKLFSLADQNKIKLYISSLSIANTNYVLSKILNPLDAKDILRRFKVLVSIIPLTDKIIDLALNDNNFSDFEDGLQYYSALGANCKIIISRDKKGFKSAKLPIMSAEEFLFSV
jgi:predicted nucleic acid-binding protein